MIGLFTSLRRTLHSAGIVLSASLPRPVASVGNLTVGGTGKTPHVAWLAGRLLKEGIRPCILSRGYGRTSRGVVWVSDGRNLLAGPADGGDEPVLLARILPAVPVVVGESRYEAGLAFLRKGDADIFILDDGFQHLSLRRDADVVLVECRGGLGNGRSIPFGPLRESERSLRFAGAVVVTKCPSLDEGLARARSLRIPEGIPVACTGLLPTRLLSSDWSPIPLPGEGWEIAAFSALARNDQFRSTLEGLGWKVARFSGFRDHHCYTAGELADLRKDAGSLPIVTTSKDMARIPEGDSAGIYALDVEIVPLTGMEDVTGMVMGKVKEWRGKQG